MEPGCWKVFVMPDRDYHHKIYASTFEEGFEIVRKSIERLNGHHTSAGLARAKEMELKAEFSADEQTRWKAFYQEKMSGGSNE